MANQTYRLVLSGNAAGQFFQNIFHYRMDDDSFGNRLLAAKGLIDGWIADAKNVPLLDMMPSTVSIKSVKARRITSGGGPEYVDVSLSGQVGTAGDDLEASANGPVIIWNTDGGPRRVGKTFIPGICQDKVVGGEIKNTFIATLQNAAAEFRIAFPAVGGTTPTCTMVIPRSSDPSTRSLIIGQQVSKYIGKQRRRQLPV